MARSKNEEPATPTRLWSKTIQILRTVAGFRQMSMAELVHELAEKEAEVVGPRIASTFASLQKDKVEPTPAKRGPGRPRKEDS